MGYNPATDPTDPHFQAPASLNTLRLGTRKSQLALWQAEYVRARLRALHPQLAVELVTMTTEGDRILDRSLAKVGGKGLFIKELEQGLLEGRTDIAVHSLKDVTATLPAGLHLSVVCEREDPRDAFVSNRYPDLKSLPAGACVGTSSLRRQCQLRAAYPHLSVATLRGNVNTRLAKQICVTAERALNAHLEGGCQVPIGGYAVLEGETLHLRGLVGDPEDGRLIRAEARGAGAGAGRP